MKAINSYIAGLRISRKSFRMVFFIFLSNLVLALIIFLPFHGALQAAFGSSMLPDITLKGFDFTAFTEFMRLSSKNIFGFISQMKWVVFLYAFLTLLFAGGILGTIKNSEKYATGFFLKEGVHYFFRFLKLFIYMLIIHFLVGLIVVVPVGLIISNASDTVDSESTLFYIGLIGAIVYFILFGILIMVSFYTKIRIVTEDSRKVFRTIFNSFGFVFKNFLNTFTLLVILLLNLVVLLFVYWMLNRIIGTSTGITILIMFLVQQCFILTRIFLRVWTFASKYTLYQQINKT